MKYSEETLQAMVKDFLGYPDEISWLEFKVNNDDPERIGKYAAGMANAACAAKRSFAYLIWGIKDKTHEIVGTHFDPDNQKIGGQPLPIWLKTVLRPELDIGFYPVVYEGKPLVVMEIEAAYRQPIAFRGTELIRVGSSLTVLSKQPSDAAKIYQTVGQDWTAEVIPEATVDDLDEEALNMAWARYAEKHASDAFADEIKEWDTMTFLNKSGLAYRGKLTRAAIILLGKPEAASLVAPAVPKITWQLLDDNKMPLDYQHFGTPLLLAIDKVFARIRNLTLREMPSFTLFPVEIPQYDVWVFREALHNCIGHEDWLRCCGIKVTEYSDRLVIANAGDFAPGSIASVLSSNEMPDYFRNRHLLDVMVELKMIDTIGSGIRRMFVTQGKRLMPLPDYDVSNDYVTLTLTGKILNMRYVELLMQNPDLQLGEIILLDKVQKGISISREEASRLRRRNLIEGRYPKIFPASVVAKKASEEQTYIEHKAFDEKFYIQSILEYICVKGQASKADILSLLRRHFSDLLTEKQQAQKVSNLLCRKMARKLGYIKNVANLRHSQWVLTETGQEECRRNNPSCKRKC